MFTIRQIAARHNVTAYRVERWLAEGKLAQPKRGNTSEQRLWTAAQVRELEQKLEPQSLVVVLSEKNKAWI